MNVRVDIHCSDDVGIDVLLHALTRAGLLDPRLTWVDSEFSGGMIVLHVKDADAHGEHPEKTFRQLGPVTEE